MNFARVRFLEVGEVCGLSVIDKYKPDPQISAFTYFQGAIGDNLGANN